MAVFFHPRPLRPSTLIDFLSKPWRSRISFSILLLPVTKQMQAPGHLLDISLAMATPGKR
jgi:hypothetical protein